MPRSQPNTHFAKRSARFRQLGEGKEHWTAADEGVAVGYRRGKTKSTWYMRRYLGQGHYEQKPIGLADDYQDADGDDILTFYQAQDRAKQRARHSSGRDKPLPGRRGVTVAEAVAAYVDHYAATSGKQIAEVERVFNRDVIPRLGGRPVDKLTRAELIRWRNGLIKEQPSNRSRKRIDLRLPEAELKRRRKATAQRKWTQLRAALNHAFTSGDVADDAAWRSIKPLTGIDAPPPARILTARDCRVVTARLPQDFRPVAQATYLTGAAYKELRETTVDDYIPATGHLRIFNTKRRARLVPLTEEGKRLFDGLTAGRVGNERIFTDARGQPWGKGLQSRRMREACRAAGFDPPVTLTDLRDAYGSLLLNAGVSLEIVSKAMGHASAETTRKHYAHLLQDTVDKAIRDALPNLGISENKVVRVP